MSGSVSLSGLGSYSAMTELVANSQQVNNQITTLTEQASSGLVSQTYSGLGAGAAVSLDLSPQIADLGNWQKNIDAATTSMDLTQTTVTQITSIAQNFYSQLTTLNDVSPSNVDTVAASARDALSQIAGLLDTKSGGSYIFAGADTANAPVPDPDAITSSGFFTQIQAAVDNLGTNGAAATTSAVIGVASSNAADTSPFSTYLSQAATNIAPATVQTGPDQSAVVGLTASANSDVTSTGANTTGSYMRDVMASLAAIGSLSSSQASDSGFMGFVQNTYATLGNAITSMSSDAGVLGNRQTALTTAQTTMSDLATSLTTQVSNVQDVDTTKTLSQLSLAQTQLQASYQLLAGLKGLSLVSYL